MNIRYVNGIDYPKTLDGIQHAVNDASAGDRIELSSGDYGGFTTIAIDKDLKICGPRDHSAHLFFNRDAKSFAFYVIENVKFTITRVKLIVHKQFKQFCSGGGKILISHCEIEEKENE